MSWHYTLRQNEFALVDMSLHTSPTPETIEQLDQNVLKIVNKFWYFPKGDDYKAYASFSHFFYSGYDAWYYSYMWAEILEADVFAKIKELWMFNPKVGKHFLETILWQGCRKPESELFKDFMWRELDNTAFMRKKWLM
jgi:oligopeptidase A